ncbi:MAG: hypothetical protein PVG11_06895, partial [Anaerolineae bacterium]
MMLTLADLAHLPLIEPLVAEIVADGPGLVVVAGIDPRPLAPGGSRAGSGGGFLPSGRATIWRILFREIMEAHAGGRAALVARDPASLRVPRAWRRRVDVLRVASLAAYAEAIARAAGRGPDLLAVDELTGESAPAALEAALGGLRVVSQLDTVFHGAGVARHLLDLGGRRDLLRGLRWVVSVQRLPT